MTDIHMKILRSFVLIVILSFFIAGTANAQITVLPKPDEKAAVDCKAILNQAEVGNTNIGALSPEGKSNILGCAIKTGRISLSMIPYFITYFANYLLSLIGIISVLFIVLGGYFYIWGGLTDKKDKGKQYITNALTGLAVATLAWIIVNAVMALFTS